MISTMTARSPRPRRHRVDQRPPKLTGNKKSNTNDRTKNEKCFVHALPLSIQLVNPGVPDKASNHFVTIFAIQYYACEEVNKLGKPKRAQMRE